MTIALDFALASWGFAAVGTLLAMAVQQDWHTMPGIIKGASELALAAAAAFAKPPTILGAPDPMKALGRVVAAHDSGAIDATGYLNVDRARAALDARQ